MRVAIVHDYIKEYGGAERVLEALHEVYPGAPIYTSVYIPEFLGPHRERFDDWNIRTSWANKLPFRAKLISPMRLIAPELFRSLDLSKYDAVIVSATGAYSPNTVKTGKATHFCYMHTPPRYLYGYQTARNWRKNIIIRTIGNISIHFLRQVDFKSSQNVDFFISNSEETGKRIDKFYRKNSKVIYPPVEFSLDKKVKRGSYFVAGGRIARAKHTDLIINAFIKNKLPLKIFGKGFAGFEEEVKKKIKGKKNIEFLGEVTDSEKNRLLAGAKGFVIASQDEDFGIAPVEAMMAGTPVIAHRSGGVLETVKEGKTGIFFDEFKVDDLNKAVEEFRKIKFNNSEIEEYAKDFRKERFAKEIEKYIKEKTK